ncbi:hypothetical protein ACED51_04060 [Photobacterium swingsii]|uniref:hypothetical protein n=1 Tax=Photobacterium swingsii TaxID=680026 RepID=UPI00352EA0F6
MTIKPLSLLAVATVAVTLSGCATTKLTPPATDFIGSVPADYNAELMTFNDEPSTGFHGGNMTYQYTPENALLTVVIQLQNARWSWNFDRRTVEKELFPQACEQFEAPLAAGMGLRYWYAGSGGFVTQVLTSATCQTLGYTQ